MQQRQLRLGDILDDYCPRERRVTNHAVVAMVGGEVKQTRWTTCDAEHEYKHAKVRRQRRKNDTPAALYAHVAAGAPKRVSHEPSPGADAPDESLLNGTQEFAEEPVPADSESSVEEAPPLAAAPAADDVKPAEEPPDESNGGDAEEGDARDAEGDGPIHRRLIRASLPQPEGQQPPARPIPEFTIRQPGGRHNRFRPRHARGGQQGHGQHGPHQFGGNRSNGNMGGSMRGPRHGGGGGGRPGGGGGMNRRGQGGGRKRSK